jgi:hypothetical protein
MGFPYHSGSLKGDGDEDKMLAPNEDKDSRFGSTRVEPERAPAGSGTEVSGYIESPVEKRCGTCEYLMGDTLCQQERVLDDPEVPDGEKGLKLVDAKNGCCSFWEAAHKQAPEGPAPATVDRRSERKEEERMPKVRLTFY